MGSWTPASLLLSLETGDKQEQRGLFSNLVGAVFAGQRSLELFHNMDHILIASLVGSIPPTASDAERLPSCSPWPASLDDSTNCLRRKIMRRMRKMYF